MSSTLDDLDFSGFLRPEVDNDFLRPVAERAVARITQLKPITPEDRLLWFKSLGYRPQGLFIPSNPEAADVVRKQVQYIGLIEDQDERLSRYYRLQAETWAWYDAGVAGVWQGQMALTLSRARFRLGAFGRRGGKTYHAAREGTALLLNRPLSSVWVCGPNYRAVGRCFTMIKQLLHAQGAEIVTERDTEASKLIVLANGSKLEGVSLENVGDEKSKSGTAVGDAVDLAIVDEAAQISPEAWTRAVLPPLMDRNGQALLISAHEGDDMFFAQRAREAVDEEDWEVFSAASWDINFAVFPQGRRTPVLLAAQRESLDPQEFLEQYGAIAAHRKGLVYPQFKERVHTGKFQFNPSHGAVLMADPSGGANPYALVAIQDYGAYAVIIDEFYASQVTAENIAPVIDTKPWRGNITDMVLDSAWPAEIVRWQTMGYNAYPVFEKPQIQERLPYHRNALRDPARYQPLYRQQINEILDEMGYPPDADMEMTAKEQYAIMLQVEERLADENLTPDQIDQLRNCARLFISDECTWTIWEHRNYTNVRRRVGAGNWLEKPRDYANHILDCIGYFYWQFHRYESPEYETATTTLRPVPRGATVPLFSPPEGPVRASHRTGPQLRKQAWVDEMRDTYRSPNRSGGHNLIVPCL